MLDLCFRARCLLKLDTIFILQLSIPVSATHNFSPLSPTKKDVSHDTPLLLSIIFCFLLLLIFLLLRMAIMHMEGLLCSVQGEVVLFQIHHLLQECRLLQSSIIMKVMFPLLMLCLRKILFGILICVHFLLNNFLVILIGSMLQMQLFVQIRCGHRSGSIHSYMQTMLQL